MHLLDGVTDQTLGKLGWGSDLAAVKSNCGSGWQILASSNGNGPGDAVKAFNFRIASRWLRAFRGLQWQHYGTVDPAGWQRCDCSVTEFRIGPYEANLLSIACSQ